jgi:hypothetical protein
MAFQYGVCIDDAKNDFGGLSELVRRNAEAALAEWSVHLVGIGTLTLNVLVEQTEAGRFSGASLANWCVHKKGLLSVMEDSAPCKLRTGMSLDDGGDARICISPDYFHREIWLDPEPFKRQKPVPSNRHDAVSQFTQSLHTVSV